VNRYLLRGALGRPRAWVVGLLLVALTPGVLGCYGSFPITKIVYEFNGKVTDVKLVHTVVFWLFLILPVYYFATLGDALIFNLIEFWTGEKAGVARVVQPDGSELALTPSADGGQAELTLSRDGRVLTRATFVRVADGRFEVRDADGRLVGRVDRAADGRLLLSRGDGALFAAVQAP